MAAAAAAAVINEHRIRGMVDVHSIHIRRVSIDEGDAYKTEWSVYSAPCKGVEGTGLLQSTLQRNQGASPYSYTCFECRET